MSEEIKNSSSVSKETQESKKSSVKTDQNSKPNSHQEKPNVRSPRTNFQKKDENGSREQNRGYRNQNNNDRNNNSRGGQNSKFKKKSTFQKRRPNVFGDFETKVIRTRRVTVVTKGGRRMSFNALVIAGDRNGRYGFGFGKANEVPNAIKKAVRLATKNSTKIQLTADKTIKYPVTGRYKSSYVKLIPAPQGSGIVAGGAVRTAVELAGIKNVFSKAMYSREPLNMVKAIMNAFEQLIEMDRKVAMRKNYLRNR